MKRLKNNMMKSQILVLVRSSEFVVRSKIFRHRTPNTEHRTKTFHLFAMISLVLICNLVLGAWNLAYLYAEDKIVAIVNNEVITQKDLNDFLNFTRMQLSRDYSEEELEKKIQTMAKDLLEKLIDDRLILQEARKNNIKIDENRIRARIAEIKSRYPSDAEFQNDLVRQGLVQADLERKMREQLLMYTIIEQNVQNKITVRPDEVTDFYHKNTKEFVSTEERDLEIIIFDNEDSARAFLFDFKSGKKIEDLSTKYPFTLDTLKAKRQQELRPDIEDVVFKLQAGEVSDPIKVSDKYYVFKLNEVIPSKQLTLSEVKNRIQAYLSEEKMQERLTKWLDELKEKSYIKLCDK